MKGDKRELIIVAAVVVITAAILAGLYVYDKGQSKTLSASINLGKDVKLTIDKVQTKPSTTGRSYLMFSATATNLTKKQVHFLEKYPTNPCVSVSDDEYQNCLASDKYNSYLSEYDKVTGASSGGSKLKLQTSKNEYCKLDTYYPGNSSIKNIGYDITDYYQSAESKSGVVVFDCTQSKGAFTLIYEDQSELINI